MRLYAPLGLCCLVLVMGCGEHDGGSPGSPNLLWQDVYDGGSDDVRFADAGLEVVTCGERVFVSGTTTPDSDFQSDDVLRAYAANDGVLLWQHRMHSGGGSLAGRIACDDEQVYFAMASNDVRLLHAYAASDGAEVWTTEDERLANSYPALASDGAVLFFHEPAARMSDDGMVAVLAALDIGSGAVTWKASDTVAAPEWSNGWGFGGLAISDSSVCAGSAFEESGIRRIQCFDKATGALRWQDNIGGTGQVSSVTPRFASDDAIVVMAGTDAERSFLRAYDADTGERLWDHDYSSNAYVADIEASGDRIFASGVEFLVEDEPYDARDVLFTDAFAARTGERSWTDRHFDEQATASALDGKHLVVVSTEARVRIYDTRMGELLSDEASGLSFIEDVAARNGRIFIAGTADNDSNGDFAVVAYSIR